MSMKNLFLILALILPIKISARNIRPMDLQESDLDVGSFKIWLLFICGFVILCVIALIADGIRIVLNKWFPRPYSLDKGEYVFVSYVDQKCFKESGEQPKSTYKSIDSATMAAIYVKDGEYYYDWVGKFLPVEENPYFGDTTIGEWGTYKYRYKVVFATKKYCPQGWSYFYFNFPTKKD